MIKKMIAIIIAWSFSAALFPLYGQQFHKNTLGSLWPKVAENYAGVAARHAAVAAAEINEQAVRADRLPQLKAQAQNTYGTHNGLSGAFFQLPGMFNVSGPENLNGKTLLSANTYASATAEWNLFSFGKVHTEVQAAQTWTDKTLYDQEAYILTLKKELSQRYIKLLYDEAKLKWATDNKERLNEIRILTSGLAAAGIKPASDSLLAYATYLQSMGAVEKWMGQKEAALIKLLELYGDDSINYAASAQRFSQPEMAFALNKATATTASHPVVQALQKQYQYNRLKGVAERKSALPSLLLIGGYAYRGSGILADGTVSASWQDGFRNTANNFLIGIGISWNLTNLRTSRLKGAAYFQQATRSQQLSIALEQTLEADLKASLAQLSRQYQQVQKTNSSRQQAQSAYEMYLARYKNGLMTLSELLQIRLLVQQAENDHIEATRDYWNLLADEAALTTDFRYLFNNL